MILLYKNGSGNRLDGTFYHSAILDAIDRELETDFNVPVAEKLRRDIAARLTQLMKENPGSTPFQSELNQLVYPMLAMWDTFVQNGVPSDLASDAVLHIWNQIPQEEKRVEIQKALGIVRMACAQECGKVYLCVAISGEQRRNYPQASSNNRTQGISYFRLIPACPISVFHNSLHAMSSSSPEFPFLAISRLLCQKLSGKFSC